MRVEQVLAWSCCRPFPTVSDRFRPFHFFWTINWTKSIYGKLIQCKPVQTMTLKFFHVFSCDPCVRTLHQILHLDLDIQYSLKITKSHELVKFNTFGCQILLLQQAHFFPTKTGFSQENDRCCTWCKKNIFSMERAKTCPCTELFERACKCTRLSYGYCSVAISIYHS